MDNYIYEIETSTSLFKVIAPSYNKAIEKIENELAPPKQFINKYWLRSAIAIIVASDKTGEQLGQKNASD